MQPGQQTFLLCCSLGISTKLYVMNAKACTVVELYGTLDPVTRDWTDGLLSCIFREINKPTDKNERKYIVFDGDVDALWVENMNSVMDDNRLLTLANGERIRLQKHCALLFEVTKLTAVLFIIFVVFLAPYFIHSVAHSIRSVGRSVVHSFIYSFIRYRTCVMLPRPRCHVVEWCMWILRTWATNRIGRGGVRLAAVTRNRKSSIGCMRSTCQSVLT